MQGQENVCAGGGTRATMETQTPDRWICSFEVHAPDHDIAPNEYDDVVRMLSNDSYASTIVRSWRYEPTKTCSLFDRSPVGFEDWYVGARFLIACTENIGDFFDHRFMEGREDTLQLACVPSPRFYVFSTWTRDLMFEESRLSWGDVWHVPDARCDRRRACAPTGAMAVLLPGGTTAGACRLTMIYSDTR